MTKREALKKIRLAFPDCSIKLIDSDSKKIHVAIYRQGKLIAGFFINKAEKQNAFSEEIIDSSLYDIKYIFSKELPGKSSNN